jgi:hypothetical protein
MTTTPTRPETEGYVPVPTDQRTHWTAWILFAAILMVIGGALQATYGLIAVVNDDWAVWGNRASLYLDLSTWGWTHLVIGTVVFVSGIGLLSGNVLARAVAVAVAGVSLISNFLVIPAYPFWSMTIMVVDLLVIWALVVHGHEMRPD